MTRNALCCRPKHAILDSPMRTLAALFTILTVMTLVFLGPVAIVHAMEHSGNCIAVTVSGLPCTTLVSMFEHLQIVQRALQGTVQQTVLVLFAAFFTAFWTIVSIGPPIIKPSIIFIRRIQDAAGSASHYRRLTWFSRFGHSPTPL